MGSRIIRGSVCVPTRRQRPTQCIDRAASVSYVLRVSAWQYPYSTTTVHFLALPITARSYFHSVFFDAESPDTPFAPQGYSSAPLRPPSSDILPVSSTYPLGVVDNDFLAFCPTSSMLTSRRFSSLSASNTLSENIGMNLAKTSSTTRSGVCLASSKTDWR
jgi:hypothetical protein